MSTGAARGIGQAIAQRLAQDGADVAVADIRQDLLQETAAAIEASGRQTLALVADVTRKSQVERWPPGVGGSCSRPPL